MVSVITPTFGREDRLPSLYHIFAQQTAPERELLVFDDSPSPSPFMRGLNDSRVRYFHSRTRMPIGAKRDRLVREARGTVIAQFDDDDYYAPDYLATMLSGLDNHDLIKLSKWFCLAVSSREWFYWDTTIVSPVHFRLAPGEPPRALDMEAMPGDSGDWLDRTLWGYGFSYVFNKAVYQVAQFDASMDTKQDFAFIEACRKANVRLTFRPDDRGLAVHVIHDANTSKSFPNYRLPPFVVREIFGPALDHFLVAPGVTQALEPGWDRCGVHS